MSTWINVFYPYMNERDAPVVDPPPAIQFPYDGTITFKWGVDQAGTNVPLKHTISALGPWGGTQGDHHPVVFIVDTLPLTYTTYLTEAAMQLDMGTGNAQVDLAGNPDQSFNGDENGRYAQVGSEYWFLMQKGTTRVWVPVRTATAAGTATITGVLCDIYTCDVDVEDIPRINGETMDADEDFSLCWSANGRHAPYWDTSFKLTPEGYTLHDEIVERVELNMRVAGERAIFEDEFITLTQLEAGNGINLLYRNDDGTLSGYISDPTKGFNVVIEIATPVSFEVGTDDVAAILLATGEAGSWANAVHGSISRLMFSDEPDWIYDAANDRIAFDPLGDEWGQESVPIIFRRETSPPERSHISARTKHTGMYASHNDLFGVTQVQPGANGTFSHIQFLNSTDVQWELTEGFFDGAHGYRPGFTVSASVTFPDALFEIRTGKEDRQLLTNEELNAGEALIDFDLSAEVYVADGSWKADRDLDLFPFQYHDDVVFEQDVVDNWRLLLPSGHTPVNLYIKQDGTRTIIGASVPASGFNVQLFTEHELTYWSYEWEAGAGNGWTSVGTELKLNSQVQIHNVRNIGVDVKGGLSFDWSYDGEIFLTVEDWGAAFETGTYQTSPADTTQGKIIRLDDRSRGNSLRLDRRIPTDLTPHHPTQAVVVQAILADGIVFGENFSNVLIGGDGIEESARFPTTPDGIRIYPQKPGIYYGDIVALGTSQVPLRPGDPPNIGFEREFSRIKLIVSCQASGILGGVVPNYYATLGVLQFDQHHAWDAETGSGEWSIAAPFSIPIGDYAEFGPEHDTIGWQLTFWLEVTYPRAMGYRPEYDRIFMGTQTYVDLHYIEAHPRTPWWYNTRPRII